jgi:hypothetical protein
VLRPLIIAMDWNNCSELRLTEYTSPAKSGKLGKQANVSYRKKQQSKTSNPNFWVGASATTFKVSKTVGFKSLACGPRPATPLMLAGMSGPEPVYIQVPKCRL